jgi:transcriptional regulator with GAF, ATPase, and Fis domain
VHHHGVTTQDAQQPGQREVASTFAELARVVHTSPDVEQVCAAVVAAAPQLIAGCDHASLMVKEGQRYRTVASSDAVALAVDELERRVGDGPCVDAIEDDAFQLDPDIAHHSQWPTLAARVLAETPVRGMAGYRLIVDGRKTGALNVFCDTAGQLDAESADAAAVLAAFASVALAAAAHAEQASTMAEGIESNREIGTAIGLLMAAHGLDQRQAFETLRKASSHLNRKLSSIAHEIVERGPEA